MNVTRIFLTSWLVVLVLSLGTNTIAATAAGVAHEINCADRHDRTHGHDVAHEEFVQSSDNMMVMDADHDQETCMNHACPALFINIGNYQVDPQLIYSKLLYFDPPLRVIERVESLHRPPST